MTKQQIIERRKLGESIPNIAKSLGVSPRRIYQLIGASSSKPRVSGREAEVNRLV